MCDRGAIFKMAQYGLRGVVIHNRMSNTHQKPFSIQNKPAGKLAQTKYSDSTARTGPFTMTTDLINENRENYFNHSMRALLMLEVRRTSRTYLCYFHLFFQVLLKSVQPSAKCCPLVSDNGITVPHPWWENTSRNARLEALNKALMVVPPLSFKLHEWNMKFH